MLSLLTGNKLNIKKVCRFSSSEAPGQFKFYHQDSAFYVNKLWAGTPGARRQVLFPFLWSTVAREGQLYGSRPQGYLVTVVNGMWFSYPGYNEILTENPDDKNIHSKDKALNSNCWVSNLPANTKSARRPGRS